MHVLPLFPRSGFDQSVTTPVLLGVLVSWWLTEAYGWVFAGLVVPGYLAAVFLLDPPGGAIDVLEAILTYGAARVVGEHLSRTGLVSRVFGRERFFLIVLASVLVRVVVEAVLLPNVAPHATWAFSIGLVVVPLAANACWKTGLVRGVVQNGVPTLAVYLLLRYVFVPYTNLSLEGFELATENVAASFLASPKAYILLVTGAVLAAAANVRYGWDFNGILVPALMGLVVIEPVKFLATLAEALVLVFVVALLRKLRPLARANIEGPRRTVLFFGVDYVLRFAFAMIVGRQLPGGDIVELMGFGYLLPTLLAVKISEKSSVALVLLPAAKVSGAAFALGTLVGFGANVLDRSEARARAEAIAASAAVPMARGPHAPGNAAWWVSALALASAPQPEARRTVPPHDVPRLVDDALDRGNLAARYGLAIQALDGGMVLIRERFEAPEDRQGLPAILARRAAYDTERLVLLVERPLDDAWAAAVAGDALAQGRVDGVVIAQVEGAGRGSFIETAAHAAARGLRKRGLLATLHTGRGDAVGMTRGAAESPRLKRLLEAAFQTRSRSTEILGDGDDDADITVSASAVAAKLGGAEDTGSLASPTEIALALDAHGPAVLRAPPDDVFEDLIALRRLVLAPLLGATGGGGDVPRIRAAAAMLGYRLMGPAALPDGELGLALFPADGRPLAVVTRAGGVKTAVVEAPRARGPVRDLAARVFAATQADAMILGLRADSSAMRADAMRVAHAAATSGAGGRAPGVVVVREGEDESRGVVLGVWGDDITKLAERTRRALRALGVSARFGPIDVGVRETAGRAFLGQGPLVVVTADERALRAASLEGARDAARIFAAAGIALADGADGDVAESLARSLPAARPPATMDLAGVARQAAVEHSIVARRELARALDGTAARAALARTAAGEHLVVVARIASGVLAVSTPTDGTPADTDTTPARARAWKECAATLANAGACVVEAGP
jgi:hypothetical protein